MIKRITALVALSTLGLAACGGVDRAGTRDEYIKTVEAEGLTADRECIDEVLDRYSDEEITAAAELTESDDPDELTDELAECVDFGG